MGIAMSKSSAFSTILSLIFEIHEINGALFLSVNLLSKLALLFGSVTVMFPFTQTYASEQSHKSDLRSDLSTSRLTLNFNPFFSNKPWYFIVCWT